jgi:hypothetical protein
MRHNLLPLIVAPSYWQELAATATITPLLHISMLLLYNHLLLYKVKSASRNPF